MSFSLPVCDETEILSDFATLQQEPVDVADLPFEGTLGNIDDFQQIDVELGGRIVINIDWTLNVPGGVPLNVAYKKGKDDEFTLIRDGDNMPLGIESSRALANVLRNENVETIRIYFPGDGVNETVVLRSLRESMEVEICGK